MNEDLIEFDEDRDFRDFKELISSLDECLKFDLGIFLNKLLESFDENYFNKMLSTFQDEMGDREYSHGFKQQNIKIKKQIRNFIIELELLQNECSFLFYYSYLVLLQEGFEINKGNQEFYKKAFKFHKEGLDKTGLSLEEIWRIKSLDSGSSLLFNVKKKIIDNNTNKVTNDLQIDISKGLSILNYLLHFSALLDFCFDNMTLTNIKLTYDFEMLEYRRDGMFTNYKSYTIFNDLIRKEPFKKRPSAFSYLFHQMKEDKLILALLTPAQFRRWVLKRYKVRISRIIDIDETDTSLLKAAYIENKDKYRLMYFD
jgi:hypothetical protein